MSFITNRIMTKPTSLDEAIAKVKDQKPARSLDQILAAIDAQNKGVKVAAPSAPVKTASAEAPKVEAPKAEVKTAAAAPAEVKVAAIPPEFKEHQFGKKGEEKDEKKDDKKEEKGEKKEDKKDKKEDKKPAFLKEKASTQLELKIAKSLDFRQWEAADVVKAWGQHKGLKGCVANVKAQTNNPEAYCGLLQVASQEATKVIKTAQAKAQTKIAETKEAKGGEWKKIAKLTDKERGWLSKYWGKLYGDEYVKAMLEDN